MNVQLGVCVLFCLLAHGAEGNRHHVHRENFNNFFENINGHEYEKCHIKIYKDAMKQSYNQAKCQPRDAVVKLMPTKEYSLVPDKVIVKRCQETGCYGKNSCAPTATREVRVAVRTMPHGQRMTECGWINVTEHTQCKCRCIVKPEHCNKLQRYIDEECMCKCMNTNLKAECLSTNMTWDEETCTCKCNAEKVHCSTGTYWVPDMCKCMRMMMMDESYDKYQMLN